MLTWLSGTSLNQRSNANINPLSLFANGEQGVWYDPSDIKLDWRKNLFVQSENLSDPSWSKLEATVTSWKVVPSTVNSLHYITQTTTLIGWETYTFSLQAINSGYNYVSVECYTGASFLYVKFNVNTGTIASISAGITATTPTLVSGKWQLSVTMPTPVTDNAPRFTIFVSSTVNLTFVGDGTSGVIIDKVQLERNSVATSYQKITDGIQDYYTYQPLPVLYQDYQGTQPVTAVEQPVGLMLDKSKGITLGSELVTNWNFDDALWWNLGAWWTISWGVASAVSASSNLVMTNVAPSPVEKTYRVSLNMVTRSAGLIVPQIGGSVVWVSAVGSYVFILRPTGDDSTLYIPWAWFTGSIDNVSVREIIGSPNHASQSTSASRPILSARYNYATYSELVWQASNPWAAYNFVIENNSLALPAWAVWPSYLAKLTATPTPAATVYSITCPATTLTVSFYAHLGTRSVLNFLIRNGTTAAAPYGWQLDVNGVSGAWFSGVNLGGGIYRITVNVTSWFSVGDQFQVYYGATWAVTAWLYWYVGGMDIRVPNQWTIPIYQKVVTNTNYDTTWFPPYLKCDGVDDGMATNTIDFTGTDKMTVVAWLRKLTELWVGTFVELSSQSDSPSNNGTFRIRAPWAWVDGYDWSTKWTLESRATALGFAAPITNVVTGVADIANDVSIVRVNGAQAFSQTYNQWTGNYWSHPLYLFRRNNSDLPFNGQMYGLIIRGATTDTNTVKRIEKYLNKKVGKIY